MRHRDPALRGSRTGTLIPSTVAQNSTPSNRFKMRPSLKARCGCQQRHSTDGQRRCRRRPRSKREAPRRMPPPRASWTYSECPQVSDGLSQIFIDASWITQDWRQRSHHEQQRRHGVTARTDGDLRRAWAYVPQVPCGGHGRGPRAPWGARSEGRPRARGGIVTHRVTCHGREQGAAGRDAPAGGLHAGGPAPSSSGPGLLTALTPQRLVGRGTIVVMRPNGPRDSAQTTGLEPNAWVAGPGGGVAVVRNKRVGLGDNRAPGTPRGCPFQGFTGSSSFVDRRTHIAPIASGG